MSESLRDAASCCRCENFDVAELRQDDDPRKERLEELVRLEATVAEAAEAAADAAAHAVEATKAAEAASVARASRKEKVARTAKAAQSAKKARAKSRTAEQRARAASTETVANAPLFETSEVADRESEGHDLELRLHGEEWEQIEQLAADRGLEVPALVRMLLRQAMASDGQSGQAGAQT